MMILFDGTPSRPLGKMLFAPESTQIEKPVPPPVQEKRTTRPTDRLRFAQALKGVWFTSQEAATAAKITRSQAASTLTNLLETGELQIDRTTWPYRYRWTR